ncbi:LamG-like jellyroll fold domain-containing protein [Nonomuraea wenchangensis]|uniref:LamG-like jellyroll fold domain-containing protein n=1 Tax=Nonomuraea wenchangensis TaxID=568860 RepID=UPI00371A89F4
MSAPAIAQGPTPPAATASEATAGTTEPTLKAAWDQAAKTGKPVEVPTHSTETMKVWANPDGKNMRAELHTRPVQLKNAASGAWEPIDTRIVTHDGKLQASRVKTPLTFGGRGARQLVSALGKHGEIGLGVTRALPEPKVSGNAVTYPDAVAPGADLVVLAQADGFISQVVFRQRPTAPVTVRLPLTLPEGTTFGKTPQGLPQLKDAKGKAEAAPIVLTATDAKVEAAPEQGRTHPVKAQVETTGKTSELVFTPDEKFLADPAVTYPVTVAASSTWFGGGAPDDAWISKNDPYNNNSAAGYLRAGTTSTSADIARVYLKFNTSDPVLQGATVNDADLRIWNYKSGGPNGQLCGETMGAGIRAARVTGEWTLDGTIDSLDWYNQPPSTAPEEVNRAGYNYDADPASWCAKDEELFYEVTAMTRAWIQQGKANHGIVLKAASETAAINWRQYYSSQFGGGSPYPGYRHPPALIIDYTPAPTETKWVKFESDDDLTEFPTYQQAKALEGEPLDGTVNWALSDQEADEIEQLGVGTPYEIDTNRLQPLPDDVEVDPATLDPNEVPAGDLPLDETEPTVTDVRPVADSTGVPVGTTITATFSEAVWEPKITVKDAAGNAVQGAASLDPARKVLTFTPAAPLKPATVYDAEVSEAYDEEGNQQTSHSWHFTTENDTTPPTVSAVTPAAQATGVPVTTPVMVTFSEAVTDAQFALKDPAGMAVAGTTSMDATARVLTFTPAQPLSENTAYNAEVFGAKDVAGNAIAQPHIWSFTTGAKAPAGLVAAYGLNEGSGTSVADSSGKNNPGTGSGTVWANGKYGKALSFNGSSSMVTVAHAASLRLTTGMTLSAWVNPTTVTGTAWRGVVTKELSADGASYALYAANGGTVPSGWVQTDPDTPAIAEGLSPLPVNSWSHLALTYDGAALRLFVNGQEVDQAPLSGSLHDDGSPLRIGGNVVWREYFSGLIDEVRIYNRAQSAAEIQTDMTSPIGGAASPDTQAPTAPGSLTATGGPGSAQLTWTASTDNVGVDAYRIHRSTTPGFTPSAANQIGSSPATSFSDAGLAAGTYYYRVRAADAAGNLSPSSNEVSATVTAPPATPGLVAAYGMEEGSGTTVRDSSGQNNTGAASDTTWTTTGKHGKALSFNGTSSWVTVPHSSSLRLTNALTLSAWVRPAALSGGLWRTVIMKEHSEWGGVYGLYASSQYNNAPGGWLQTSDAGGGIVSGSALPLNQWSHLALTYDGSTARLYVNGSPVSQPAMTGAVLDDGGALRIGGNAFWGEFYSGLIDEVRVYNRVQTAVQIQADMNSPVGSAPAPTATALRTGSTGIAPGIEKLAISENKGATPQFTAWTTDLQGRPATVEVEVADRLAKSPKPKSPNATWTPTGAPAWSGKTAIKADVSRQTVRVPAGKLHKGEQLRWRARTTVDGVPGAWSEWQTFTVGAQAGDGSTERTDVQAPPASDTTASSAPPARATVAASDPNTSGPFSYDRMNLTECNDARLKQSPRPSHGFGWTVARPYTGCYSRVLGWGDWDIDLLTGLPKTRCPRSMGVMMTATVVAHTYLGTKNGSPVVYGEGTDYTARDISVWVGITNVRTVGADCEPTTAHDGLSIQIRGDVAASEGSSCSMVKGANRTTTIGGLKRSGTDNFVFRSGGKPFGNCTLRPKLYPPANVPKLDPSPFRLWQYLATEQGPPIAKGDLPFVARCDSERISYRVLVNNRSTWRGNTGGCRFLGVDRVYTMYTGDPHRGEVAQHIQYALQHPRDTDPKVTKEGKPITKNFPGNYDGCLNSSDPTHCRIVPLTRRGNRDRVPDPDGALYNSKNSNNLNKYCKDLPGRDDPNKQCDEYPFASTWQAIGVDGKMENSVWVPSLNASLRMVGTDHNQAAGRDLGAFYARYRVLPNATLEGGLQNRPGNAFFVRIKEGAPPTPSS